MNDFQAQPNTKVEILFKEIQQTLKSEMKATYLYK